MSTEQALDQLWADGPRPRSAREVFPVLVRQAFLRRPIAYSDLASAIGAGGHRHFGPVLEIVGQVVLAVSRQWGESIPPLTCLVVKKRDRMPGEGVGTFVGGREEFGRLPIKQKKEIVRAAWSSIYDYDRWLDVLDAARLPYGPSGDFTALTTAASKRGGTGEGEPHHQLKVHISQNPHLIGVPKKGVSAEVEARLPSGDIVDVLFRGETQWTAAEVKSHISDVPDICRGYSSV